MADYWPVPTELTALLPQPVKGVDLVTATSMPVNLTKVDTYIGMVESEVNGAAAAAGYVVPISSAASGAFGYIQMVTSYGVRWQVLEQINPGSPTADEYKLAYRRALEEIREGKQPILSAAGGTGRSLPRSGPTTEPRIVASWNP